MYISRFDMSWIRESFIHCLTAALDDLSLTDL